MAGKKVYSVMRTRVICPHCGKPATTRTSRLMSEISREISFQCTNDPEVCGFTWVALLSAIRTIVPSRTPNQNVHIPLSDKNGTVAMSTAPPS